MGDEALPCFPLLWTSLISRSFTLLFAQNMLLFFLYPQFLFLMFAIKTTFSCSAQLDLSLCQRRSMFWRQIFVTSPTWWRCLSRVKNVRHVCSKRGIWKYGWDRARSASLLVNQPLKLKLTNYLEISWSFAQFECGCVRWAGPSKMRKNAAQDFLLRTPTTAKP